MKGKPNFPVYSALSAWNRSNSSIVQASSRALACSVVEAGGQFAADGEPAGQVGMGAQERQLALAGRRLDRLDHGRMQRLDAIVGRTQAAVIHGLGDPGRMLVDAAEALHELRPGHGGRPLAEEL